MVRGRSPRTVVHRFSNWFRSVLRTIFRYWQPNTVTYCQTFSYWPPPLYLVRHFLLFLILFFFFFIPIAYSEGNNFSLLYSFLSFISSTTRWRCKLFFSFTQWLAKLWNTISLFHISLLSWFWLITRTTRRKTETLGNRRTNQWSITTSAFYHQSLW